MKKPLPELTTDEEAEAFLATDLTEYDWSNLKIVKFEFEPKSETMTMRMRPALKQKLKKTAAKIGMPYQKFAHQMLEAGLHNFDERSGINS